MKKINNKQIIALTNQQILITDKKTIYAGQAVRKSNTQILEVEGLNFRLKVVGNKSGWNMIEKSCDIHRKSSAIA